ncbi:dihydrolipoyl dehydrogenase [Halomicrococcus gelatinilyticus]|uniref:dihydrolipoyl dehydrogenase n=1 Tax=Halomicrococcus gelatinilyticus TaxID=1702103 RepID=UPI002E10A2FB
MQEFDFVVVGSGSGLDVASTAVRQGLDVAVVEEGPLGGTCLNRGCIPSKMLIHRADLAEEIRDASAFGIDATIEDVDFAGMVEEVTDDVAGDAESIERGLRASEHHTLFHERGRFVDERTLEVGDERIRGETVLVAAGTRPKIPDIDGIDDVSYLTSKAALELQERPDRLIVVGGGYIAAELGHFFGAFGTDVSIVGRRDVLLPDEDREVSETFTEVFARDHDVYAGYEATAVSEDGGDITVRAEGPDDAVEVTADELLVAAGRQPNTDTLNVEAAGIETDEEGFVETNEYLETTADDVWALGDIVGNYLYKHSANHEARYVARNALGRGEKQPVDYTAMPHAVFSSPQVAGVGRTEQELRDAAREFAVRTYEYGDTAMGQALMEDDGFVKVLADPEDAAILGCHIVGPDASSIVHEVVVAMTSGSGTVHDVRETIHVHPALNEVVQRAFSGQFRPSDHEHHQHGRGHEHDHNHQHDHEHGHDH